MALQPLLQELRKHLERTFPNDPDALYYFDNLLILFYVDDGYLAGPTTRMVNEALRFLKLKGPKYGYRFNQSKTVIVLGKCATAAEEGLILIIMHNKMISRMKLR